MSAKFTVSQLGARQNGGNQEFFELVRILLTLLHINLNGGMRMSDAILEGSSDQGFGLKDAAVVGSAIAAAVAAMMPGAANASVVSTTLGSPVVITLSTASSTDFDLDGNSVNDYTLVSSGDCSATCSISASPNGSNQIYLDDIESFITKSNQAGMISDFSTFEADFSAPSTKYGMSTGDANLASASGDAFTGGDWLNDGTGVLGLEFDIDGVEHLGYIEGTVANSDPATPGGLTITVGGYGYDTDAAPNPVPEPGTLSLLAMGAVGIGRLRRRRLVGAQ